MTAVTGNYRNATGVQHLFILHFCGITIVRVSGPGMPQGHSR